MNWLTYDADFVSKNPNRIVLLRFSADWSVTSKMHEKFLFRNVELQHCIEELGVVLAEADLTKTDDLKQSWLESFGTDAIPSYVIFSADRSKEPVVLTQVTADVLADWLHDIAGHPRH